MPATLTSLLPWRRCSYTLLAAAAFAISSFANAQAPALNQQAGATLPSIALQAGMHVIQAELAETPENRQTGLMYRQALAPNHGMLFKFEDADIQCFWMRNTYVPLSIAFIDTQGRIVNIADMQPLDETPHCSAEPVALALEMQQGWFKERGLETGATLRGLPASSSR